MGYHSTSEMKNLSEPSPRPLPDCYEARDLLLRTFMKDGFCIAVFRFGAVALPEDLEPRLREMVGKEVCCLRLDHKYYIREA